jgi:hypothetical protein
MEKKDLLDKTKALFFKNKVLDMRQLQKAIQTHSRRTVLRYLNELHCFTSYTHTRRYYALSEVVQFDENGFWHYGDIGFSSHGTLMDTLQHVITTSESGKTNSELSKLFQVRVQNSLQRLLKPKKITVASAEKPMLYISSDPSIGQQQIEKRQKAAVGKKLPLWIIAEILIACVHTLSASPNMEDVMKWLKKMGSTITKEQVKQVFEEEHLEKKTPD